MNEMGIVALVCSVHISDHFTYMVASAEHKNWRSAYVRCVMFP